MAFRSFTDSAGLAWHAWDVVPQLAERRLEDRRQGRETIPFPDRRNTDRRVIMSRRAVMAGGLSSGWLCFEGASEKRRLSPIPEDWARCPETQLEEYCRMAAPVRRPVPIDHPDAGSA